MKNPNSITSLPEAPGADRERRFHRYVWQMSLRVVLFVAAIFIWAWWHTWLFVIPIALAAIIPWVAVIIANAGNRAGQEPVRPAGGLVLHDAASEARREQEEQARAQAYRDEQDRLRDQAQRAQSEWQAHGSHSHVWGRH
jgi:predicted membrane metal-binding protein